MGRRSCALGLAILLTGACSPDGDIEIAGTDSFEPTTDTVEPPDTEPDTTPPDTEPDTTPPDTEPDTTPPDTETDTTPPDTLSPDDPSSSTTVVDPVTAENQYPLGTEVLIEEVGVKVTEFVPDASSLYDTSLLEVPAGFVVVAVRAVLTNYSPAPVEYFYPEYLLVRPDGTGFWSAYCFGPVWLPSLIDVALMPGGTAETVSCFIVPGDAVGDVSLWLSEFGDDPEVFALQPGQGGRQAAPPPARPSPPVPGSSPQGSWRSPVPVGTPATAADYTITVTGFQEAAPTPEFAQDPPEGWRYIGVDLEATFNGSNPDDAGFVTLQVVGESGRLYREDFECQFDDTDDPFEATPGVPQSWSRCFAVQDVDLPSLELAVRGDFSGDLVFLALR